MDTSPGDSPAPPGRLAFGLAVAAVVVAIDQATKAVALQSLEPGVFVAWLSRSIGWELVHNPGAAFGLPLPSLLFPVVVVVVAVVVVATLRHTERLLPAGGYALLLAGAVGNVIDRIFRSGDPGDPAWLHGHVVDFVAWGSFPRFNVADIAINVGLALLVVDLLAGSRDRSPVTAPMLHDLGSSGPGASPTVRIIAPDGDLPPATRAGSSTAEPVDSDDVDTVAR